MKRGKRRTRKCTVMCAYIYDPREDSGTSWKSVPRRDFKELYCAIQKVEQKQPYQKYAWHEHVYDWTAHGFAKDGREIFLFCDFRR